MILVPGSSNGGPVLPHPQLPSNKPKPDILTGPKVKIANPIPKSKPPGKPRPASALDKYLAGDTTYQQQLADLNREQSAYQSNINRQNQITNRNFDSTQRQMNTQAGVDRTNQQYDFAGRGILHSGVFAKALGDYNTDFQTKVNNLIQGKTDTLNQSSADLNDFLRQVALQKNSAKQDAIRRRQQQLGI